MLSQRDAFKVGFLSRCVEEGLTVAQMRERVKAAADKLAGLADLPGQALDLAKPVLNTALSYGVPLALAAPPIVGGLAGYGLGRATDIDDTTVSEVKKRELIAEYERQTSRLLRDRAARDYRNKRKTTGRIFL